MKLMSIDTFNEQAHSFGIRYENNKIHINGQRDVNIKWSQYIDHVFFSKKILEIIGYSQCFLAFFEYGIWPQSENRFLFTTITQALLNKTMDNPDEPIAFDPSDHAAARTFLQMGLQSGWGGIIFGLSSNYFYFNHDSLGRIYSENGSLEELRSIDGVALLV